MADKIRSSSAQRNYHYNRTHTKQRSVSYDHEWRKFSLEYRELNPFCVFCLDEGIYNGKHIHVDHITPLEVDPSKKYDLTNLRSVCRSHHGQLTRNFLNTGKNELMEKDLKK